MRHECRELRNSTSWRVTAPLRAPMRLARGERDDEAFAPDVMLDRKSAMPRRHMRRIES
jgi:hypothetical protein